MCIESLKSILKFFPVTCVICNKSIAFERAWQYVRKDKKVGYMCIHCAPDRKEALRGILRKEYPEAFKKVKITRNTNLPPLFHPPPAGAVPPPEKLNIKKSTEDMLVRIGVLNPTKAEAHDDNAKA